MRLRVSYDRPADLVRDYEEQFKKGGLLVRVSPPAELSLFAPLELELVTPFGAIVCEGQAVQLIPDVGVAVTFAVTAKLEETVRAARKLPEKEGAPASHSICGQELPKPEPGKSHSSAAEKIHQALHGNRDERAMILRDINKTLHPYVLKNPGLQLDEVHAIAKMTTVGPELLKMISDRREWVSRPEIAIAMVRNPKTAVEIAIRLLEHVSTADLRHLAKDPHARGPIQKAARKKVLF